MLISSKTSLKLTYSINHHWLEVLRADDDGDGGDGHGDGGDGDMCTALNAYHVPDPALLSLRSLIFTLPHEGTTATVFLV